MTDKCINKIWYTYLLKYHLAKKNKEVLVPTITLRQHEKIMSSKKAEKDMLHDCISMKCLELENIQKVDYNLHTGEVGGK